MNREERFKLYERLYFQELDRREKIGARLPLPFAALLATVGLLSFMLNSSRQFEAGVAQQFFWLLFSAAGAALLVGAHYFRRAWYGQLDEGIPTANQIEAYHAELVETYGGYRHRDDLVDEHFAHFLFKEYKEASSANTLNNDLRTRSIYSASLCLTVAVLLALSAAVPFYLGTTPQKEIAMPEQKPPPPPPPPPRRYIKDDVPKTPPMPPPDRR